MATADPATRRPGLLTRFVGVGAVVGAILWPIALGDMAVRAISVAQEGGAGLAGSQIVPLAIALLLFSAAIAALERHATREIRFPDLVGDLTIATATVVFVIAAVLDSYGLLGPGFVLLFIGSMIYGAAGFDGKRRPRWGSVLVGIGAGGLLASLLAPAALGTDRLDGIVQTALLSLVLYAIGWAWLGLHLALARPLVPPPGESS